MPPPGTFKTSVISRPLSGEKRTTASFFSSDVPAKASVDDDGVGIVSRANCTLINCKPSLL